MRMRLVCQTIWRRCNNYKMLRFVPAFYAFLLRQQIRKKYTVFNTIFALLKSLKLRAFQMWGQTPKSVECRLDGVNKDSTSTHQHKPIYISYFISSSSTIKLRSSSALFQVLLCILRRTKASYVGVDLWCCVATLLIASET